MEIIYINSRKRGLKMRGIKLLILVVFVLSLFQLSLYSLITSRVEGTVIDKDTLQPIRNVTVYLFVYREKSMGRKYFKKTKTDTDGLFLFDDLNKDRYFVMCEHEDYLISPPRYIIMGRRNLSSSIKITNLKEGQIKHFVIELKKGGKVKGRILKREISGESGLKELMVHVYNVVKRRHESMYAECACTDENGNFLVGSLTPGDKYKITIEVEGFPIFRKLIDISKGETTVVNHTFDETDKTGVYGIISRNGEPIKNLVGGVTIYKMNTDIIISSYSISNTEGNYIFKNIIPGLYKILYSYLDENRNYHSKSITIEIEKNISKQININF